ncbi:MAG: hypothetical protein ACI9J3_000521 [Parvicellaceae bacterium]|jgi:hypothetical protein
MIFTYLINRSGLVRFILLSVVFSLLIYKPSSSAQEWVTGICFLLGSFLVFRIIDDLGSVRLDRINHPDRTYLNKGNFSKMVMFGSIVLAVYLTTINFLFSEQVVLAVGLLSLGSILSYLLVGKSKVLLAIIPLLKYPVLLWCLMGFPIDVSHLLVAGSSFFIIGSHELIEKMNKKGFVWLTIGSLLVAGIMVFPPWEVLVNSSFCLTLTILIPLIKKWKLTIYVPALYFPVTYFILSNIII